MAAAVEVPPPIRPDALVLFAGLLIVAPTILLLLLLKMTSSTTVEYSYNHICAYVREELRELNMEKFV